MAINHPLRVQRREEMAHELTIAKDGLAEMAYAGAVPWHGLGQQVTAGASIEDWAEMSRLTFTYLDAPVKFDAITGYQFNGEGVLVPSIKATAYKEKKVLYRSDNHDPMAVVGTGYKVVQPTQILEFFRDLVADDGFEIETVGSLRGGRRIWALANTGQTAEVVSGDKVKGYLLLATSCDGSLATTGMFTSVRVVCNNTLTAAFDSSGEGRVRVRHNTVFDPSKMKGKLNIQSKDVFEQFMEKMSSLARVSMSSDQADSILNAAITTGAVHGDVRKTHGYRTIMGLFQGMGMGAAMDGVAGTKWGLLNAVTEYVDHHARSHSSDNRLNSAWFGPGSNLKMNVASMLLEA
jgi:phage/plasmid-like protein (TIGR03299 family)